MCFSHLIANSFNNTLISLLLDMSKCILQVKRIDIHFRPLEYFYNGMQNFIIPFLCKWNICFVKKVVYKFTYDGYDSSVILKVRPNSMALSNSLELTEQL